MANNGNRTDGTDDRLQGSFIFKKADMERLFHVIAQSGYDIIGPRISEGAIILDRIEDFADMPVGYTSEQSPGQYRIHQVDQHSLFRYTVSPHSLKKFLHPSSRLLFKGSQTEGRYSFEEGQSPQKPLAFFGVRGCDAAALSKLDRVFAGPPENSHYQLIRKDLLLVTATCNEPDATCFCDSMGTGPVPQNFDINIMELIGKDSSQYLIQSGSERGQDLVAKVSQKHAEAGEIERAKGNIKKSLASFQTQLATDGLAEFVKQSSDSPRWQDVADRCLSCANCTMVCPTCFCTRVEDINDLNNENTERWLRWDSCFSGDFSYIHGGRVRDSVRSRYRQWLTHKLGTWHDQFGESGCVGCGRCVSWCPVGIDITKEAAALKEGT